MTVVSVTEFRQNLSAWLDRVRAGEEIGVSERGTLVARVVPTADPREEAVSYFANLRAQGVVLGDIESPIDVEWEAMRDHDYIDTGA